MNAPFQSDSSPHSADAPREGRYSPSVPISVYRELATELKATQAMVDSLTQQNQQLSQQNQVLRQEMLRFVDSATQLKQALEISQPAVLVPDYPSPLENDSPETPLPALPGRLSESVSDSVSHLASQVTQIIRPLPANHDPKAPTARGSSTTKGGAKRPRSMPDDRQLYTEERLSPNRPGQMHQASSELSGLWLATTILLIVFSAFGAGFLIMKPLLNNAR